MCGGQIYLVANFTLDPDASRPSLHELVAGLLQEYPPSQLLILRPLNPEERGQLQEAREDAEIDCWALIVGSGQ